MENQQTVNRKPNYPTTRIGKKKTYEERKKIAPAIPFGHRKIVTTIFVKGKLPITKWLFKNLLVNEKWMQQFYGDHLKMFRFYLCTLNSVPDVGNSGFAVAFPSFCRRVPLVAGSCMEQCMNKCASVCSLKRILIASRAKILFLSFF